jgi:dihydrofolate reductase
VLEGDALAAVAALKQEPGQDLLKFGSGSFTRALVQQGLIDELHLWRFPVIAGTSDAAFQGVPITHLQLLDTTTFASGIVVQVLGPKP